MLAATAGIPGRAHPQQPAPAPAAAPRRFPGSPEIFATRDAFVIVVTNPPSGVADTVVVQFGRHPAVRKLVYVR